jgi:transcriptional regulator of arginine metabolism
MTALRETDQMTKITKKPANKNISFALRQLLQDGNVGSQDEICRVLQKQGYEINQTKVSRLLHKIGAIKVVNQDGLNTYRLPHEHGLMHELTIPNSKNIINNWVIDIVSNNTLIVIHTIPSAGSLVAREIDLHKVNLGVLGTIAGDDTIFVTPRDEKNIKKVIAAIKSHLEPA